MTAVYDADLLHVRLTGPRRSFRHRVRMWLVDLDDLPRHARFDARDHLFGSRPTIRGRLDEWLGTEGVDLRGGPVLMLAGARTLGHVFDPLTVFWCHRPDGSLECVVAEVHNTHGERHCYLLRPDAGGRAEAPKAFYVSPFLDVAGHYVLRLPVPGERLRVSVTLIRDGRPVFAAALTGGRRRGSLRLAALTRPFNPHKVTTLIRRHGLALWLRGVPIVPRSPAVPREEAR